MRTIIKILLVFATIFFFKKGYGQHASDIKLRLYNDEHGLLGNWISSIVQDKNNYLWVASNEGLNRFDGNSFISFTHKDKEPSSLLSDYIWSSYIDDSGNLWIGYSRGGISKYIDSCHCFKHFLQPSIQEAQRQRYSTTILDVEGDSLVWYSGNGKGLNLFNIHTRKHTHFDLPFIDTFIDIASRENYNTIFKLYRENISTSWLATKNGLYIFHKDNEKFEYLRSDTSMDMAYRTNSFLDMAPDGDKGFWLFANRGGISYYAKQTQTFTSYKFEEGVNNKDFANIIHSSALKSPSEFWISTADSGLGIFNTSTKSYRFLHFSQPISTDYSTRLLNKLFTTKDGILFGHNGFGLLQLTFNNKPFKFKFLNTNKEHPEKHGWIRGIHEDTGNKLIYFAETFGNGLCILNTSTNDFSLLDVDPPFGNSANPRHVLDVITDKSNKKWVLTPFHLYLLNEKNNKLYKKATASQLFTAINHELFTKLLFDNDGDFWVFTSKGNICKYNLIENTTQEAINKLPGSPSIVKYTCIDHKNRIWMSSDTVCAFYDKRKGKIYKLASHWLDSLSHNGLFGILNDLNGNIWLGIQNFGLVRISEKQNNIFEIKKIGTEEGMPQSRLYNMGIDHKNNIWISTNNGLILMKTNPLSFSLFNKSAGIDKNTSGMQFINAGYNSFYIATENKYCKVDEATFSSTTPLPQVYIDDIKVMNISRNFRINSYRPVVLKPTENFFSIEFGCIDFVDQASDQFAYKLDGWDQDWVYCGSRRFANYTNLDGGEYTFKVKSGNGSGKWGDSVSIPIIIEKPFFKKPWFILLLVGCLSGIVFAIYRVRIGQIRNTEKLKTEFNKKLNETKLQALRAQMNPHFIFNSLNSINRYIIKSDVKVASYYITKFSKLMRLILDNSEHRKVVLSNELEALKLYIEMESLRFDNKFSFELLVDDTVSTDRIEVPPLLIQPYVENAIWHGLLHKEGEGKLTISVKTHGDMLICEVIDNGIGREKAMEYKSKNAPTRKSIGMKLTEERLRMKEMDEEENGSQEVIDLRNEAGEPIGTKVIIKIPI